MQYKKIDELNSNDIVELFNDFLEFGDSTLLGDCACSNNVWTTGSNTLDSCINWCRANSQTCYCYNCHFCYLSGRCC